MYNIKWSRSNWGDELEGYGGGGGEAQEGEGICVLIADSHCCIAETNTTL